MSKFRVAIVKPATLVIGALALILAGTAKADIAVMQQPVPGTTLTGASATFSWTTGTNVLQYYLYVGSVFGGNDLYGASQNTNTSGTVSPLPTDGRLLYVRLWSFVSGAATDINSGWHFNDYQYLAFNSNITCGPLSKAAINSPTPSTTLAGTTVTFAWAGNSCITGYKLAVGTTGAGSSDIYGPTATTTQSQMVTGLPGNGTSTVYVRLTSTIGGTDYFNDYTYTAFNTNTGCATPTAAVMIPPPAFGSQLAGSSQLFAWGPGCGATDYYLYVGSSIGANDLYGKDIAGVTTAAGGSITVPSLPTDARTLYVRLWTLLNGVWNFNDYTYQASGATGGCGTPTPATMLTPAPGSTLTGTSATFTWMSNSGSCTTPFTLAIGNEQGGSELFLSSGLAMATTVTVNGLPTDGRALFVRLITQINNVNQFIDYTYTAFTASTGCSTPSPAAITTPAPGSTLSGASVAFTWNTGCSVTEYFLWVGSAPQTSNIYSQDQGTKLTATVPSLPTDGSKVYVRLWSMINGIWQFIDYTYTASGTGAGCGTPTAAALTSPSPGGMLPGTSVTFVWTAGSCVSSYTLSVGKSTGGTDFYGPTVLNTQSAAVGGLPSDGTTTVFARLITSFTNGASQTNDYSFTAFNGTTGCGSAALGTISSPAPNSTLPGGSVTFSWTAGCSILQYWLFVGTQVGGSDIYNQSQGNSMTATVNGLPTNGSTLYARLWSYVNVASSSLSVGWHFIDYVYTAAGGGGGGGCTTPTAATMTSPTAGTTLAGASVVFTWNLGSCVSSVTISVGSSVGASDIFTAVQGVTPTASVNNLPTNGSTVFVRLASTFTGGGSQNVDYTYTAASSSTGCSGAASAATMLTPTPSTTLPANPVTFTWTAGCNATQYYLYIGTQVAFSDIYNNTQGTSLSSAPITINVVSGKTVYVRLWSFLSTAASDLTIGWHFNDYSYTAH